MLENESGNMVMPVSPMGHNGNGMFGDGAWWLIILFVLLFGNGGWGNQNGANGLYPWMNQSNQVNDGFRDQMLNTSIQGINGQLNGLQMQVCNGFGQAEISANARQMADMNQMFGFQTAVCQGQNALQAQLAQNGMNTQMGFADMKYTLASEACATRANSTQNTQGILNAINGGIQSIKDQMCQDKIDAKNDEIATLRQQIAMKDLAASQLAQNNLITQGFSNEVDALYNRLNSCPVPTTPVYGRTPIFTCGGTAACGCGGFAG